MLGVIDPAWAPLPVSHRLAVPDFLEVCAFFSEEAGICLLHSGTGFSDQTRSYLGLFPKESVWIEQHKAFRIYPGTWLPELSLISDPWDYLKSILPASQGASLELPDWIGYLGYGLAARADRDVLSPYRPSDMPDAYFFDPLSSSVSIPSRKP